MAEAVKLTDGRLSEDQVTRYWEEGYLFPVDVIPPDEAAAMRAELEALERDWLDADLPRPLNQYKRVNAHCVIPLAARIASDPRVLDVVEGILGPDILVWSSEFFIKEARTDAIVSMHQDLTYWGMGETSDQVTAWVALSPATRASGCMDFVRGSHRNPILPHEDTFAANNLLSRGQEIQVEVAESDKVAIELQPGQMSLHHGLTIHGSGPNVSDDRRIAVAIRFIKPTVAQQIADRDYAMLVRGADLEGHHTLFAAPARPFAPRMLELYEQIRADQAKALAAGAKAGVELYQTA